MLQISVRTKAHTIAATAQVLGCPLPAAYHEQIEQAEAFADAANQTVCTTETLHRAVLGAIEAGRDYHADKDIQQMALNTQLTSQNILAAARIRNEQLVTAALTDHANDILASWADALEPHAAALAAAAKANVDLNDSDTAIARGGEAMRHLHSAQIAVKAFSTAEHGFHTLRSVAGIRRGNNTGPLVFTAARKADLVPAVEMAREHGAGVDAWILARCGNPLNFCATLDEFKERVEQFEADRQAEAREYDERRVAAGFSTR